MDDSDAMRSATAAGDDAGLDRLADPGGDGDDGAPPPPSQIYYIAAGQNDGRMSKKFYVSTIVYGVHGHPVLDRTLRMSPLQLLRRASDDDEVMGDAEDLLTPTPRDNDRSQSASPVDVDVETGNDLTPTTMLRHCADDAGCKPLNQAFI